MSVALLMNSTCNIEVETQTKNSSSGVKRSWAASATGVPCRHQDMSEAVRIEYGRLGYEASDYFYFAADPSIAGAEVTKRIVWGGFAYYVSAIQNQGGQFNKVWRATAVRKPLTYSTSG